VAVEHEVIVAEKLDVSEVLKFVEAAGCDLIVLGTDGLTGMRHRLFGGLAEEVVRLARCPVMVVKGPAAGDPPWGGEAPAPGVAQDLEPPAPEEETEPSPALHGEYLG
jgi:hypothetical protein